MVVAATGFFDGVHRGHRSVIERVLTYSKESGVSSGIITFWPHPRAVLQQDARMFRILTTLDEKVKKIKDSGIDNVQVLNFDREFARQSSEEFFNFIVREYGVKHLIMGYDHRVGSDTERSQDEIVEIAESAGLATEVVGPLIDERGVVASSSKIRKALSIGSIEDANEMLGYMYGLNGVVVEGNMLGRKIGFPTANMELYEPLKMLPGDGVYAVWAEVNGKRYKGISNIGCRPTVEDGNRKTIETHILDFDEDIYGLALSIEFAARIREIIKFPSLEALAEQLKLDKESGNSILKDI
jgi:riboflavin kinase/FMN adenylyltransferase